MNSRPMSNIDKRAQKELYATVEKRAHKLRGNPIAYQVVTGMCPVNVIEMQAQKVQALLDELEDKDKRLNEILTPNMLLPVIDDMDEDNLRHVIKTVCENYSLLHAKWEAAEKRIAELSQKADIYDMLRQDYELQGSLVDFVDWQAKRIADLESREVKLPELKMLRDYLAEVTHREREDILVGIRLELFRAIEEAGVKVATACKGEAS